MNGYEFTAALVKNLCWPIVVAGVFYGFRVQLKKLIENLKSFKASKDGVEWSMAEVSKAILQGDSGFTKERFSEERKRQQVVASGGGAGGSFTLYANGVLVCRSKIVLAAGSSTKSFCLAVSMVHEITSVQCVGEVEARVTRMDQSTITIEYARTSSDKTIEIIATGL